MLLCGLDLDLLLIGLAVALVIGDKSCSDCSPLARIPCTIPSPKDYACEMSLPTTNDPPAPAKKLRAEAQVQEDEEGKKHSMIVASWETTTHALTRLEGFQVKIMAMSQDRPDVTCRLLKLNTRLNATTDFSVKFSFPPPGCFLDLYYDTEYAIVVTSVPISNIAAVRIEDQPPLVRTRTLAPEVVAYRWSTNITLNELSGGKMQVMFDLAPDKFNFSSYHIRLEPDGAKAIITRNTYTFVGLCPFRIYTVKIKPSRYGADGQMVCLDEFKEERDCMTTFAKFNVSKGNPDVCVSEAGSPIVLIATITVFAAIALTIFIFVSIMFIRRWREKSKSHGPSEDECYGSHISTSAEGRWETSYSDGWEPPRQDDDAYEQQSISEEEKLSPETLRKISAMM